MTDNSDVSPDPEHPSLNRKGRIHPGMVLAGIVLVALLFFILQNGNDTRVHWLFFKGTTSLWLVIVLSAVAGAVLGLAGQWLLRRRRYRN
jgi:uncharacterized integral membrane protein